MEVPRTDGNAGRRRPRYLLPDALPRTRVRSTPDSRAERACVGGPGTPESPARSLTRPAPTSRPAPRPARATRLAHRVLLLHHLVHLLGNADHFILHGSRKCSRAQPVWVGKWAKLELRGRQDNSPGAGLAHHSRPGPKPFLTNQARGSGGGGSDSDSAPADSANRAPRALCRH